MFLFLEHVYTDDVARHEIRGALHTFEFSTECVCQGLREQCLAQPRRALEQHVAARDQGNEQCAHRRLHTQHHTAELLHQGILEFADCQAHAASCLSVRTMRLCRRTSGMRRSE
jgi:hypothetical protein